MPLLIFNAADVRRVVEHSISAPKQSNMLVDYDDDGKAITKPVDQPAVLLVHDQGVYLMSNGTPRDIVGPDGEDKRDEKRDEGRSFCAYAKGCDPVKDGDWWNTSCDLVGGDDFGETLPMAREILALIERGAKTITFLVTPQSIQLVE